MYALYSPNYLRFFVDRRPSTVDRQPTEDREFKEIKEFKEFRVIKAHITLITPNNFQFSIFHFPFFIKQHEVAP